MSNGYNKNFMSVKERFLDEHPITVCAVHGSIPEKQGVYEFDIQQWSNMAGVFEIISLSAREKKRTSSIKPILAHWLPWESQKAVYMDLNDEAKFFFTSEINGCQFKFAPLEGGTIRVIHVAGDSVNAAQAPGSQWRGVDAVKDILTKDQQGRSRRFTSSAPLGSTEVGETGSSTPGTMVGYGGNHFWQNVFGFRKGSNWEFWYQTVGKGNNITTGKL